jgi:hypothetical protein
MVHQSRSVGIHESSEHLWRVVAQGGMSHVGSQYTIVYSLSSDHWVQSVLLIYVQWEFSLSASPPIFIWEGIVEISVLRKNQIPTGQANMDEAATHQEYKPTLHLCHRRLRR